MDLQSLFRGGGSDGEGKPQNVAFNKQSVTAAQVSALLAIVGQLTASLERSNDNEEEGGGALDGGVKSALDSTLLSATSRLDDIIGDPCRWNTEGVDSVASMVEKIYQEQILVLKLQQNNLRSELRPAILLRPRLAKIADRWWAIHGEDIANRLTGSGTTPAEAIQSFESQFYLPDAHSTTEPTEE